ncbi:dihydrolipoyl dehydrogenase [Methanocella sp. CWC-04]|uniref:Dihydrolipoyl dehydrogenase n=1 Tax=Methanooceanicella nereidis TaxID=2052831 RepID=A0AAP2RAR3_9EURY|nr:dihydrolipoyl dehydrogenase [Methanocella sp. CWC-04]MCD1294049.1 dihydrolipoyl dehydrogenase [Methanocella sp. CWC-04]
MEKYDVIVIGSGAGFNVAYDAVNEGLNVALLEHGPLGGTCLNTGCIPSKTLIYPADVIRILQDAKSVGVEGNISRVDFDFIMKRMRGIVEKERRSMEEGIRSADNLTWYRKTSEFISDHTLKCGDETVNAPKIVIASGSREGIPPIEGLKETGYIDHVSLLKLDKLPGSLIIIGGGYIGCEYGHFFSALGSDVTLIGRSATLMDDEEPEVSNTVTRVLSRDFKVHTNHEAQKVEAEKDKKVVHAKNRNDDKMYRFEAEEILVATGRRSNSDILKPERTGVETDKKGWIKVNKYLETNKPGIYALGDATGKNMYRHTANYEAEVVSANMLRGERMENDQHAIPHAVFTHPQIGGVGMKESEAAEAGYNILVGKAVYMDAAKGYAMAEQDGFVKLIVEKDTRKILGCSIIGPEAPVMIQQVVYLMNTDSQDLTPLMRAQIIHPTLSEVITKAVGNLEEPESYHEKLRLEERGREARA